MSLLTEPYLDQQVRWPREGRHILAHHDAETIVVYQAFRPSVRDYVIEHGAFGGDFSYARMSWIKPNFLWMMYRSGWGSKDNQEATLGLRLRRQFFDHILALAVASSFEQSDCATHAEWKTALENSDVRLQWDPDHGPDGRPLARRAIQLGLRGDVLADYGKRKLVEVIDLTAFVAAQREYALRGEVQHLRLPSESVYRPNAAPIAIRLKLD